MATTTVTEKKPKEVKKEENSGGSKAGLIAFIITTILSMGAAGYLFYDNSLINEEKEIQSARIVSLGTEKENLIKQLETYKAEIQLSEGKNAELQSLVDSLTLDIDNKIAKIRSLKASNASLAKFKKEYSANLSSQEENLKKIKALDSTLALIKIENEQLKASLGEANQQVAALQEKNLSLEKKIQIASILKVSDVIVIGEKKGKGDKYAPTSLKKAERLLVTFDVLENKIADPGEKEIHIKVTNPDGKVIENSSSGTFTQQESNMTAPYTVVQKINYNNAEQKIFAPVEINKEERKPGNYTIEFYSNGYLSGVKKVTVK